jgi:hypothetical protein
MSLDQLFSAVAREQDVIRASTTGRERIRRELSELDPQGLKHEQRRRTLTWGAAATGIAAIAAAIALFWGPLKKPDALTVSIGSSGHEASVGALLGASDASPLPLHFSDGTQIEMAAGARARLVELDANGAHMHIENGKANVHVIHRPAASWRLTMGPFAVRVTGTRFDVRWDAARDEFELALQEGHVVLSGCVFGDGKPLTAGQTVRASCKRDEVKVGFLPQAAPKNEPAAEQAKPTPTPVANEPDSPALGEPGEQGNLVRELQEPGPKPQVPALEARAEADFRELVKQGKYVDAFNAADRAGFEALCAKARADELVMLGDSARYAGNARKATFAFKLARSRFPRTGAAALSAFALGRLEFDSRGSYQKAAEWFRVYLSEQPSGALSREARGRLMEALNRSGDTRGARTLAEQYLKAYPSGPHAALAQRLQAAPEP